MATVRVSAQNGTVLTVRALIDQGSQSCFISEKIVKQLKAVRIPTNVIVECVGSLTTERVNAYSCLTIQGCLDPSPVHDKSLVLKQVTGDIPQID